MNQHFGSIGGCFVIEQDVQSGGILIRPKQSESLYQVARRNNRKKASNGKRGSYETHPFRRKFNLMAQVSKLEKGILYYMHIYIPINTYDEHVCII